MQAFKKYSMRLIMIFISLMSLQTVKTYGQTNYSWTDQVYISIDKNADTLKNLSSDQFRIIKSLQNLCDNHKIIKDSADMFLIIPFIETDKQTKSLWVKKNDFIHINIRQGDFLKIYLNSDTLNPTVTLDIKKEKLFDKPTVVLNWRHGWYKVSFKINDTIYEGWIKGADLCPYFCTTCS
jgi:hypothetical protein